MSKPSKSSRFLLWIDAVGSFLVCDSPEIRLGQAVPGSSIEVPLLADVSRHHATIRRDEEGYVIEPIREVQLSRQCCTSSASLCHNSLIALGGSTQLRFSRPHPLSATARLDFVSAHRLLPAADAVLLMADTCVLGPAAESHVVCRQWTDEVVLFRQQSELFCRAPGNFEVDGAGCRGRARITLQSRIAGEGFSFSLEEV